MAENVCWICFSTRADLIDVKAADIKRLMWLISRNKSSTRLACRLCWQCFGRFRRFMAFKATCERSIDAMLKSIAKNHSILNVLRENRAHFNILTCSDVNHLDLKPHEQRYSNDVDISFGTYHVIMPKQEDMSIIEYDDDDDTPSIDSLPASPKLESQPIPSNETDDNDPLFDLRIDTESVKSENEFDDVDMASASSVCSDKDYDEKYVSEASSIEISKKQTEKVEKRSYSKKVDTANIISSKRIRRVRSVNKTLVEGSCSDATCASSVGSDEDYDYEKDLMKASSKKIKIKPAETKRKKELLEKIEKKEKEYYERTRVQITFEKCYDSFVMITKLSREKQLEELDAIKSKSAYKNALFKCEDCAKGFSSEIFYKMHRLQHNTVSGEYSCSLCKISFRKKWQLKYHTNFHCERFTCKLCGKTFKKKYSVLFHLQSEHTLRTDLFKCEICNELFSEKENYQLHMKGHGELVTYKCHICSKTFHVKIIFNTHVRRHRSKKKIEKEPVFREFYCTECDKTFETKKSLNSHFKFATAHVDPEKYRHACDLCDLRFKIKGVLKNHILTFHKGYKKIYNNHICEICGKGFTGEASLLSHNMVEHIDDKAYTCKYCGVKFVVATEMYKHINLRHSNMKGSLMDVVDDD